MIAILNNWSERRVKVGKGLMISIILLLCIFQIYTLYVIYYNSRNEYVDKIFSLLIAKTDQLNLTKSQISPVNYFSYNPQKNQIRIIKTNEDIDTLFQIEQNKNFRLANCQASYDIRDSNIWNLDTLVQMLSNSFRTQALSTNFKLTLLNKSNNIVTTYQYGNSNINHFTLQKELDLGFLERHKLTITFIYPFHYFWAAASDRIITTGFLFLLLIFSSISLFVQLRDERRTSEYRKKFTHTLVHNLRSPLLASKQHLTAVEVLPLSPEKRQEAIQISIQNITNVLKDIEKLLSTSVNAYGLIAHQENFDPERVIHKLAAVYQQNDPDKKVHISIDCQECPVINADPTLLEGALGNLIGNSIKYSGPEVHIHITCRKVHRKVFISVEDDGFGIAPEEQQYIFQENFRGDRYKNDRSHKGFGLGLFYVQAVVRAHRGQISVESDGHNGTTFILELPQK